MHLKSKMAAIVKIDNLMRKMSNKNKHEVSQARTHLDATLQSLVDKKDDTTDEPGDSEGEGESFIQVDVTSDQSPMSSPTKRSLSNKPNRKRKRKDDQMSGEVSHYHHTYIMKLFDRSVDLAQFDEDTPLYPVCRAWMKNQPHNRNLAPRERSPSPDPEMQPSTSEDELSEYPNVYSLPGPIKQEVGAEHRDSRIPPPLPNTDKPLDIHADPDDGPPPEQLLLNHMARWKRIRSSWIGAARQYEMKYTASLTILKDMFERQLKDG